MIRTRLLDKRIRAIHVEIIQDEICITPNSGSYLILGETPHSCFPYKISCPPYFF